MGPTPQQDLLRQTRWKTAKPRTTDRIGSEIVHYFKASIRKKQEKFGAVSQEWLLRVPADLQAASELVSFSRGTLVVVVQGAPNLYHMKQALLAGLSDQLCHACRAGGLRKIVVRPGRLTT